MSATCLKLALAWLACSAPRGGSRSMGSRSRDQMATAHARKARTRRAPARALLLGRVHRRWVRCPRLHILLRLPGIDPFHPGADGTSVWIPLLLPWFITRITATLESVGDVTATARYSGKRSMACIRPAVARRAKHGCTVRADRVSLRQLAADDHVTEQRADQDVWAA